MISIRKGKESDISQLEKLFLISRQKLLRGIIPANSKLKTTEKLLKAKRFILLKMINKRLLGLFQYGSQCNSNGREVARSKEGKEQLLIFDIPLDQLLQEKGRRVYGSFPLAQKIAKLSTQEAIWKQKEVFHIFILIFSNFLLSPRRHFQNVIKSMINAKLLWVSLLGCRIYPF